MYQVNEKIEYMVLAGEVAQWAEVLFGYFVKSNRSDEEKGQLIEAFANELETIPNNCLNFIHQAKAQWIEEAHPRPPSIPQFLAMLRVFNNIEMNNTAPRLENMQESNYQSKAFEDAVNKADFIKNYKEGTASKATEWVMRDWLKNLYLCPLPRNHNHSQSKGASL
jgi:hypothetical protein